MWCHLRGWCVVLVSPGRLSCGRHLPPGPQLLPTVPACPRGWAASPGRPLCSGSEGPCPATLGHKHLWSEAWQVEVSRHPCRPGWRRVDRAGGMQGLLQRGPSSPSRNLGPLTPARARAPSLARGTGAGKLPTGERRRCLQPKASPSRIRAGVTAPSWVPPHRHVPRPACYK